MKRLMYTLLAQGAAAFAFQLGGSACMFGGRLSSPNMADAASDGAFTKDMLFSFMLDGLNVDQPTRAEVNELLLALESKNPTPDAARSSLLNGVWQIQFAGAPGPGLIDSPTRELALVLYATGFSAGALVTFLGKLPGPLSSSVSFDSATVSIRAAEAGQPRVSTEVKLSLFAQPQMLQFSSNLVPMSALRMREDIVELSAFGQRGLVPGPLARSRQLFVTYLDEQLLVVRDESGVPDVLVRKNKFEDDDLGMSPLSVDDDDASPGAS